MFEKLILLHQQYTLKHDVKPNTLYVTQEDMDALQHALKGLVSQKKFEMLGCNVKLGKSTRFACTGTRFTCGTKAELMNQLTNQLNKKARG